MCLAIPAEIIQIENETATIRVGDALRKASLMLLPEEPQLGDYVIVHAGFALHKLDPAEAQESLRLLRELAQTAGEDSLD
jgi:hydrogenase expression/formation protein HypC